MDEITPEVAAEKPSGARSGRRRSEGQSPLKLPAELGIEQVSDLKQQLGERFASAKTVVIDAADVQRIHTAVVQLFCLFCRDRRNAGREVQWQQPSAAMRNAAAVLGVTTLLQIAQEEP